MHAAARAARCSTTRSPFRPARDPADAETRPECGRAPLGHTGGWTPTGLPFHRRQADLVETSHPGGDRVAQGTPNELGGFRVRAAIADREQGARRPRGWGTAGRSTRGSPRTPAMRPPRRTWSGPMGWSSPFCAGHRSSTSAPRCLRGLAVLAGHRGHRVPAGRRRRDYARDSTLLSKPRQPGGRWPLPHPRGDRSGRIPRVGGR